MQNFIINEELKNLLPPISEEEAAGLEESILQYGCLTPIVVWNGTIVDGHYRYAICTKHGIPFSVRSIVFADLDDAKLWAWQHQQHRRNLTAYHRGELALKLKSAIAARAKMRQGCRNDLRQCDAGQEPTETNKLLGELAGVSHDTIHRVGYIVSHADEETKEKLRRGEKGTSINKEYSRLKSINTVVPNATPPKTQIFFDEKTGNLAVRSDTTPEELAVFLVEHFPAEYIRDLIRSLLQQYGLRYGEEALRHFLLQIDSEFID